MAYQTVTPLQLGQAVATTSAATLYTVPGSTRTYLKNIDIVNTSATSASFDIYLVPSAGTAGVGNALFYQQTVAAKTNVQWSGLQVLSAGATIQIKASATTTFTITASGGEAV